MFADRIEYTCTLRSLTPLHLGSGDTDDLSPARDSNQPVSYALVVRDFENSPYIPATSIKGAIRQLASLIAGHEAIMVPLFGSSGEGDPDAAYMGSLTIFGASMLTASEPETSAMPFATKLDKPAGYINARTAIKGSSGVADDHKLFHQEFTAAGVEFTLRATLHLSGKDEDKDKDKEKFADRLFAVLARDGLVLGKSKANGNGQLSVVNAKITKIHSVLTSDGVLQAKQAETVSAEQSEGDGTPANQVKHAKIELICPTPFLVADASARNAIDAKKTGEAQVSAQRQNANTPLLPPSSVAGALRARARWLWLKKLATDGTLPANSVFSEFEDKAIEALAPVIALFGSTENMALLHIRECTVSKAEPMEITSVKLDHFSGGPVDNALFKTAAFVNTHLTVGLALTKRRGCEPGSEEEALFDMLIKDLEKNGIMLGAGTNKGFGWFTQAGKGRHHGS